MARDFKLEVAAVNLRIPNDAQRDYIGLIMLLSSLRRGVRVHGDTVLAIQSFDDSKKIGTFAKFTEIDTKGDWFNLENFETASPEDKINIHIPDKLKPNYSAFYFKIHEQLHTLVFESYADSKGLSPNFVEKYFARALTWNEVASAHGTVQADIIKDYDGVERLLSLPNIKEISFTIKRPNPDDIDPDLFSTIEEMLAEQNADEYEESWRAKGREYIHPSDRSFKMGIIAAENGSVDVKNVQGGVTVPHSTNEMPLKESITHKGDISTFVLFQRLAGDLFERVRTARNIVREQIGGQ